MDADLKRLKKIHNQIFSPSLTATQYTSSSSATFLYEREIKYCAIRLIIQVSINGPLLTLILRKMMLWNSNTGCNLYSFLETPQNRGQIEDFGNN